MKKAHLKNAVRLIAAVPAGALATLSFAPYDLWYFSPIALTLLFLLLHRQSTKMGAWTGFFWGSGLFGTGIFWVHVSIDSFGGMPMAANVFVMALLISYLALYPALFGGLLQKFQRPKAQCHWLLWAPILWLITEWLRGWVLTGFPWLWLGYSQINTPLAHFAPILGVQGISLAIAFISGGIALALTERKWHYLSTPVIVFTLGYLCGLPKWTHSDPNKVVDVALVQGNIPQEAKWSPDQLWPTLYKYVSLTEQNWDADVIVWPEAAVPALESQLTPFLENLDQTARQHNVALITGILDQKADGQFYNNILVLGKDANGPYTPDHSEQYSKHHLVPFGEYVPFEKWLRPLAPLFNLPMSSFSEGPYIQPNLEANGFDFEPALCYEIAFGKQLRANWHKQTNFILTLSNDAWFGRSIGPEQHLQIAQMRALELGRPLIRDTNNGITAIVNAQGQVLKRLPQFVTGVLRAKVESTTGMTPYAFWGGIPLVIYCVFGLGVLIVRQRYSSKQAIAA